MKEIPLILNICDFASYGFYPEGKAVVNVIHSSPEELHSNFGHGPTVANATQSGCGMWGGYVCWTERTKGFGSGMFREWVPDGTQR